MPNTPKITYKKKNWSARLRKWFIVSFCITNIEISAEN